MRSINRHVSLLFRMGERFLNHRLKEISLSSGTAPLLLELRDGGERNPAALAAALGVNKAHVSRALQSLAQAGFVSLAQRDVDRRIVTISLTETGRAAAGEAEQAMLAWVAIVSRGVSQTDLDTVNAVFDTFYENALKYFTIDPLSRYFRVRQPALNQFENRP